MKKVITINIFNFMKNVVEPNSYSFEGKTINLKSCGEELTSKIKGAKSQLTFKNCRIIIEDFSEICKVLLNNPEMSVSVDNCQIFIRFFKFSHAFVANNRELFNSFYGNEIIIYNSIYEHDKEALEDLYDLTNTLKNNNCKIILSLKCIFKYYPEDFARFIECLKWFKMQLIHFNFLYTSDKRSSIPNLTCFSSILGELHIRNANLNRRELPFCYNIYLEKCKGSVATISRNITISRSRDFEIRILPGAKINIEDGSYGKVWCNGKFSLFFDNPVQYSDDSIEIVEGSLRSTNKKSLLKERYAIHKYKLFVNEDFSTDNKISKFYKCKFINCFFNSNQYLLDCEFKKCFFSEGEDFVINS